MTKASLLDANVLLALAWPDHVHHAAAHRWFAANSSNGWATCDLTQIAFVRLSSNPAFTSSPATPEEARDLLRRNLALSGHRYWTGPRNSLVSKTAKRIYERIGSHGQVSDAYLVLVAEENRGRVATFDRGLFEIFPDHAMRIEA